MQFFPLFFFCKKKKTIFNIENNILAKIRTSFFLSFFLRRVRIVSTYTGWEKNHKRFQRIIGCRPEHPTP